MAEKIFTFLILIVGIIIFFNIAGLQTFGGVVLEQLGLNIDNAENFRLGALFTGLLGSAILALMGTGAVALITGGNPDISVTALYATPLIALIADLLTILVYTDPSHAWTGVLLSLIIIPISAGYVVALYDWVRGKD